MNESSRTFDQIISSSSSSVDEPAVAEREDYAPLPEDYTIPREPIENEATREWTTLTTACKIAGGEPQRQFTNRFLQVIQDSEFEFGFSTPADEYVRQALSTCGAFAREWINDLFVQNFKDPFLTSAILRVIAHFDYSQMYPQGMTMALASTVHIDAAVRECGIRCFENWESSGCLTMLRSLSFSEDWLQHYLTRVIADLEGYVSSR